MVLSSAVSAIDGNVSEEYQCKISACNNFAPPPFIIAIQTVFGTGCVALWVWHYSCYWLCSLIVFVSSVTILFLRFWCCVESAACWRDCNRGQTAGGNDTTLHIIAVGFLLRNTFLVQHLVRICFCWHFSVSLFSVFVLTCRYKNVFFLMCWNIVMHVILVVVSKFGNRIFKSNFSLLCFHHFCLFHQ